jgi:hypothetical protein
MVRRRSCSVSNQGGEPLLRDAAKTPLLRMRKKDDTPINTAVEDWLVEIS